MCKSSTTIADSFRDVSSSASKMPASCMIILQVMQMKRSLWSSLQSDLNAIRQLGGEEEFWDNHREIDKDLEEKYDAEERLHKKASV